MSLLYYYFFSFSLSVRTGLRQVMALDRQGYLPVHHAAEVGNDDILRLLLDYGADPSAPHTLGLLSFSLRA
jgi:hypothetical protein